MSAYIRTLINHGAGSLPIDIECHISNSLPNIVIVGFAGKTVEEAKERLRGAFSTSGLQLPRKRISINLAPADIPKDSSSLDLALAIAILTTSHQLRYQPVSHEAFIGELGLDGTIRPVRGIIGKLLGGRAAGISRFYVARQNIDQARLVPGIELVAPPDLRSLVGHLQTDTALPVEPTAGGSLPSTTTSKHELDLHDVVGQDQAKRALIIAAAGGHNVLLSGPPGTGKSLLAKVLAGLMPPMSREEVLEATQLHSLATPDYDRLVTERPFRAPHHTASTAAILGGGSLIRPGEVSLSHRGVLFFDELPEFSRFVIEAMRQPLEDRRVVISRANQTAEFPAAFTLVATANPCPCGFAGIEGRQCSCTGLMVRAYRQKLSGPLLDRIDLCVNVVHVDHERLLQPLPDTAARQQSAQAHKRVEQARALQRDRFQSVTRLNRDMTNRDLLGLTNLEAPAKRLLDQLAGHYELSARGYMRALKVARTIADLVGCTGVQAEHITEAVRYRAQAVLG